MWQRFKKSSEGLSKIKEHLLWH